MSPDSIISSGQDTPEMSRRAALGCLLPFAGLVGLGVMGIRGCISSVGSSMFSQYQELGEELQSKFAASYPNFASDGKGLAVTDSATNTLASAEKALVCYGNMLSISNPFDPNQKPLLNSISELHSAPDSFIRSSDMRSYPEFSAVEKQCLRYRGLFAEALRDCRSSLQQFQQSPEVAEDRTEAVYTAQIVMRLERLADNIDNGTLMTKGNILNHTNKFGTFTTLIGEVDHFDDCIAEIRALREYREKRHSASPR